MGIEPTSEAWEASILPLYDARSISCPIYHRSHPSARCRPEAHTYAQAPARPEILATRHWPLLRHAGALTRSIRAPTALSFSTIRSYPRSM